MTSPAADDPLTPEQLAALGMHRADLPIDLVHEQRVLEAWHHERANQPARFRSRRIVRVATAIAAAIMLFVSGTVYGRQSARHTGSPEVEVQRAGSEYVQALARLAGSRATRDSSALVQGLEAGTATLHAAATSIAQLAPTDPVVQRIRAGLDIARPGTAPAAVTDRSRILWF